MRRKPLSSSLRVAWKVSSLSVGRFQYPCAMLSPRSQISPTTPVGSSRCVTGSTIRASRSATCPAPTSVRDGRPGTAASSRSRSRAAGSISRSVCPAPGTPPETTRVASASP